MLAHHIAKQHNLYVVPVTDGFVVYRKNPTPKGRGIRLGRRKDAGALLAFVKRLTQGAGVDAPA